jgi:hypothetical protein
MTIRQMPLVYITDELAQRTAALLNSFAMLAPAEGVVYWFGIELVERAVVTTLVVPDAHTHSGCVHTSVEANAAAVSRTIDTPLVLLGQAHSHPGAHVWHSIVDDEETFARFDGAISIVVPWFGRYGFRIEECGVHRHLGGRFQVVRRTTEHIRIIPGFSDLRASRVTGGPDAK